MLNLALIGKNIAHSKSQAMYAELLRTDVKYDLIDCAEENQIPDLNNLRKIYSGVSITSPYKQHFLDDVVLDESARICSAINCLEFSDCKIVGHNTDYMALKTLLPKYLSEHNLQRTLILGDGTMSRVVRIVLDQINVESNVWCRKINGPMENIDLSSYVNTLVINCCSRSFSFDGIIGPTNWFFDLNYNLCHPAYKNCARHFDGLEMLKLQARYAAEIWKLLPINKI